VARAEAELQDLSLETGTDAAPLRLGVLEPTQDVDDAGQHVIAIQAHPHDSPRFAARRT